jgi:predicted nucleic acid-binding Zn ribbon protein
MKCRYCGSNIPVDALVCPHCREMCGKILKKEKKRPRESPAIPAIDTRPKCRYCGSNITVDALVCPHCREILKKEGTTKDSVQALGVSVTSSNAITVFIISGIIGGIILIVGIMILFESGFSGTTGITLIIIGFIICAISFGILSQGECCYDCCGC